MELLRQHLLVFAQLTPGVTISNYLNTSPNSVVTTSYARGLVNTFRSLYSYESTQTAWTFIKSTIDTFLDHYSSSITLPLSGSDLQLVNDAIRGISTLTETYQYDYHYVGTIRVEITHWEMRITGLSAAIPSLSYSNGNTWLGNSYSETTLPLENSMVNDTGAAPTLSSTLLTPSPHLALLGTTKTSSVLPDLLAAPPANLSATYAAVDGLNLDSHQLIDASSTIPEVANDVMLMGTSPSQTTSPQPTPVLDNLNLTINTIAAQSQARIEIISRAQQRWLDHQSH